MDTQKAIELIQENQQIADAAIGHAHQACSNFDELLKVSDGWKSASVAFQKTAQDRTQQRDALLTAGREVVAEFDRMMTADRSSLEIAVQGLRDAIAKAEGRPVQQ